MKYTEVVFVLSRDQFLSLSAHGTHRRVVQVQVADSSSICRVVRIVGAVYIASISDTRVLITRQPSCWPLATCLAFARPKPLRVARVAWPKVLSHLYMDA